VHINTLRSALLDAVHGRLSTFLISNTMMSHTMGSITRELKSIHPTLGLAFASTAEAYQSSDFLISRRGRDIYITIKFPVTPLLNILTLYEVVKFPVVMPDSTDHVTKLNSDITGFTYSPSAHYYMLFRTLPVITHHMLFIHGSDALQHYSAVSCISALFHNTVHVINRLCSFTLYPFSLQPSVLLLDKSTVLFTNVSNITRSCVQRADEILPGCLQCIHRLPCSCSFQTLFHYVPPHLTGCGISFQNDSMEPLTHVTNLAVLSHFFAGTNLGELASDTLLRHPILAILPNFTFFDHQYATELAAIDDTKFHLSKAINHSIAREITFRSMAEYLTQQKAQFTNDENIQFWGIPHVYSSPLLLTTLILSVLAIVFSVVLSIRLRILSTLMLVSRPSKAVAPTMLNFFTTTGLTMPSPTSVTNIGSRYTITEIMSVIALLSIFALIAVLALLYLYEWYAKRRNSHRPYTKIYLQLILLNSQIYVLFMTLRNSIGNYVFTATEPLRSLQVAGTCFLHLIIDWPTFTVTNNYVNTSLNWPRKIRLSYFQARILRAPFTS